MKHDDIQDAPGREPARATSGKPWRRVCAGVACVVFIALLIAAIVGAQAPMQAIIAVGIGILLTGIYALTGSIPERLRKPWVRIGPIAYGGLPLNEPDDPSNLPYKIVVPILIVVIAGAAIAIVGLVFHWW
jgi:hypothetical protein